MSGGLRPYQVALVDRLRAEYASGARSVVLQLGTGGGKTHTAAELIRLARSKGSDVVFAAHLDSLVEDTAGRLRAAGVPCGIVKSGVRPDPSARVQVASLGTLHSRGERPAADLLILDECHRGPAPTVRAILEAYPRAKLLGLSAWPERADGVGVGDVFERLVSGPSVAELTAAGFLVPAHVVGSASPRKDLAGDPVALWLKHCSGRRGILFAVDVAHAQRLQGEFAAVGVRAALCLGETDSDARRAAREGLASGELDVVLTCRALLEGWDCPAVDAVVFCGQAGTLGSWLQGCGRGLRAHPGKTDCLVLDLRGYVWLHGLPSDPRRCSLDGKAGRAAGEVLPALRRCRACFAISRPSSVCPRCGEPFPVSAREVTHGNGRLVEVSTVPDPVRARKYLDALVERFARGRGANVARWRLEQRALMAAPDWVRAALH